MDLTPTPEQAAFRAEVRDWLQANVPGKLPPVSTPEGLEASRAWERTLFDAGYAAISWPSAYGGRDADLLTQAIFAEEYVLAGAPARLNGLGLGLAGPTLIAFGTDEQKARWLPGILSGEDIWCQGFSEPDAGSDLAALRTAAVREGDELLVNGQKIWTSAGTYADWIFALVRTNPSAPKHQGITFVMIDMHSPGIEVRPIRQINGDAGFSEVFFTDVRVPVENVVGRVDDGWNVAMATLGFERGTSLGSAVRFAKDIDGLIRIVKAAGLDGDPLVRDRVARAYVDNEVFRQNNRRTLSALAAGQPPGPEASLTKLYWSQMEHRIYEAGMDAMGELAQLTPDSELALDRDHWQKQYWYSRAAMIYAGTSQIQRNIISERVLGLPKEVKG